MRSSLIVIASTDVPNFDLISLAAAKAEFGITDDSEDVSLQARITRASQTIASLSNRVFALQHVIETFNCDDGFVVDRFLGSIIGSGAYIQPSHPLMVSRYPVVAIESISVDDVEIDAADYDVHIESGLLWRVAGGIWSGKVVVTYSGGYDLPEESPGALQSACLELVTQYRFAGRSSDSSYQQVREVAYGDRRVVYSTGTSSSAAADPISPTIMGLIALYRRPAM